MRGADEVQSCTLISILRDGARIGVQFEFREVFGVSLTRDLFRHSPPPWGEVAQKGETLYRKTDRVLSPFYWLRSEPWSRARSRANKKDKVHGQFCGRGSHLFGPPRPMVVVNVEIYCGSETLKHLPVRL